MKEASSSARNSRRAGLAEEVAQGRGVEDRHPLAQPGALRHVVHRCQLGGGLLDQHGEHQEGRRRDRPSVGRIVRAEYRAEQARMLKQPQQRLRVATQPRSVRRAPGPAHLTGTRHRAKQPEVSIGQMARILTADHRTVHVTTVSRHRLRGYPPRPRMADALLRQ